MFYTDIHLFSSRSCSAWNYPSDADHIERNLQVLLRKDSIVRDVQRQWKRRPEAILPLFVIGWEEDLDGLWEVVKVLDQRFAQQPFPSADAIGIRLLEGALDDISAQILEKAQPRIRALYPSFLLRYGLLEGYWCIYALLPRGAWDPPGKPIQHALFP